MPIRTIKPIFYPDMYHGWSKKSKFFEGWYYKLANTESDAIYAIIAGISIDKDGKQEAFIQVLDGINAKAKYYEFGFDQFRASSYQFEIFIADNHFTRNSLSLNLPDINGHLEFSGLNAWPNKWYSPGIMGPYTFVPFMECYHGIISMDHLISGELSFKGLAVDFTGGRGYTEKDWGKSFPEAYLWLQSNHFIDSGTSLKLSVARIPWIGRSFTGFIAGFLHNKQLYEFTTYNLSKIEDLDISQNKISVQIKNNNFRLRLRGKREKATILASPVSGEMSGRISESMTSVITIELIEIRSGSIIYKGQGTNTAIEVAGDIDLLV